MKSRMRRFHVGRVQVYLSDEANRHVREVTIMLRLLAKDGAGWKWEATAALAHARTRVSS